jgi:hypothetical protein
MLRLRVVSSIALGMRKCYCLRSQKAHRENEAEAPKEHDMQSKQKTQKHQQGIEQFTVIAKTFEKIESKLSLGAVGNVALNSGQDGRAPKVEISLQVPQGCASLDDLRFLSRLVYQNGIPVCGVHRLAAGCDPLGEGRQACAGRGV